MFIVINEIITIQQYHMVDYNTCFNILFNKYHLIVQFENYDCVCMRVNILVNFCIVVDGLWYGLELPVCREGTHCLHPAQGRAVEHPRGVVPGIELSTDLREVSVPGEGPNRGLLTL